MAVKKGSRSKLKSSRQKKSASHPVHAPKGEFEDADPRDVMPDDLNKFPEMAMMDEVGDPDVNALNQEEDLFEDVIDLKNPEVAAELSEDPVRLYLREIGQVKLLDSDSEFRLATMIEANRLVVAYRRHPLRKNLTPTCSIYHSLLSDMFTAWERLVEDAERLNHEPP